jgi:hypothetical protein
MKLKAIRVAHGGPYDVRLSLFENEVPQGNYLDFALIIENKGEVTQDVLVDYWVTGQNTTYYSKSEAVLTPSLTNQSFTRNAYIYSTQPLGTYTLNARVTYDNVQPSIITNTTFMVISKTTPQPPPSNQTPQTIYIYPPAPTGGVVTIVPPSGKISSSILITSYDSNISLARNITKIESVTVKNNGVVDLSNVSIFILGIPLDWFNITPESYTSLPPDNSTTFLIEFHIPGNAKVDEYKANLVANAGIVSDQKVLTIKIYQSLEELLKNDIKDLKSQLQDLYIDMKVAEKEGKDTSTVLSIYNEANNKVNGADQDVNNGNLEDALSKISGVPNLIKRARDLLDNLKIAEEIQPFPIWIIFTVFIAIIVVVILLVVILWKKKKLTKIRPYVISLGRIADIVKKKEISKEGMEIEKEKLTRMLKILDSEKAEGIISQGSYEKMRKSIEDKLAKLEKK